MAAEHHHEEKTMKIRHGICIGFVAIALAAMFTLAGCPMDNDDDDEAKKAAEAAAAAEAEAAKAVEELQKYISKDVDGVVKEIQWNSVLDSVRWEIKVTETGEGYIQWRPAERRNATFKIESMGTKLRLVFEDDSPDEVYDYYFDEYEYLVITLSDGSERTFEPRTGGRD
jgi:uncharacterized membrane protein YkoI